MKGTLNNLIFATIAVTAGSIFCCGYVITEDLLTAAALAAVLSAASVTAGYALAQATK